MGTGNNGRDLQSMDVHVSYWILAGKKTKRFEKEKRESRSETARGSRWGISGEVWVQYSGYSGVFPGKGEDGEVEYRVYIIHYIIQRTDWTGHGQRQTGKVSSWRCIRDW